VASRNAAGELTYSYPAYRLFDTDIAAWDLDSMRAWNLTGGTLTQWPNAFYCRYVPEIRARRPRAYRIRASETAAIAHVRLHNLHVEIVETAGATVTVERWKILDRDTTASPDVGDHERRETVFLVQKERVHRRLDAGDALVHMDQPLANVAIYLLEPESDDGLVRWGWFDHCAVGDEYPVERVVEALPWQRARVE
jgi:hypothetical protein